MPFGISKVARRASLAFFLLFVAGDLLSPAVRSAAAQPPPAFERRRDHGGAPFDRFLERHAERLKLDDATRERIRAVGREAQREASAVREQVHASREEMRRLLNQDSPDEAAVMRQAERIGSLETEMQKQRLRTMLRIRALLTPEQRQELVKIREERGGRQRRTRHDDPGRERPWREAPPAPTPGAG
jgi:Spy/CpxP family protein refolding chaperone